MTLKFVLWPLVDARAQASPERKKEKKKKRLAVKTTTVIVFLGMREGRGNKGNLVLS